MALPLVHESLLRRRSCCSIDIVGAEVGLSEVVRAVPGLVQHRRGRLRISMVNCESAMPVQMMKKKRKLPRVIRGAKRFGPSSPFMVRHYKRTSSLVMGSKAPSAAARFGRAYFGAQTPAPVVGVLFLRLVAHPARPFIPYLLLRPLWCGSRRGLLSLAVVRALAGPLCGRVACWVRYGCRFLCGNDDGRGCRSRRHGGH